MKTPIADFLSDFSTRGGTRMYMPGHKGKLNLHDITEVSGADVLYSPTGIIKESEACAEELFETARTVYSTEGSSLSVKAMLALTVMWARERGEAPLILAGRNAHKTFISAAALLDFEFEWIYGSGLMDCKISTEMLMESVKGAKRKPTALYITSPDYLGNISDIGALAKLCHELGMLLLVDNAHGAYLKFLPDDIHPITLGADVSCDSAHKSLPCLTGAGYLQISKNAPAEFSERADEAMALFASTSPSYLILESLDLANAYIASEYRFKLKHLSEVLKNAKHELSELGFSPLGDEMLKITLSPKEYGYTGRDIDKFLCENNIISEFSDDDYIVLLLSAENTEEEINSLLMSLKKLPRKAPIKSSPPNAPRLVQKLSPRAAMLSPSRLVSIEESVGHVLASATVSCPPAVPIAISGELITEEALAVFKYYGTKELRVVKE